MKLLTQHAAIQLYEKVKSLEEEPLHAWRCIHINLADQGAYNVRLRTNFFVRPISQMLEDEEGYIFACDDGDIFILFKGAIASIMDLLDDHYSDIEASGNEGRLFVVYDLGLHWEAFFDLCARKSRQAIQQETAQLVRKPIWYSRISNQPVPQ